MPSVNLIVSAAAGAGKTTRIVREAIATPESRIIVTTYTNNNEAEIRKKFFEEHGAIPANVTIKTWFTLLLEHFVRPYQRTVFDQKRIQGLAFVNMRSAQGVAEANTRVHYFAPGSDINIYSGKISKFALKCNAKSGGAVIARLEKIADRLVIDEVQDLAAWDLDLIELLFGSKIDVTLVGDHRQSTYQTNNAAKHKKFAGVGIIDKFEEWYKEGRCELEPMAISYRCHQGVCDFADKIFADCPDTVSHNQTDSGHDGVFLVAAKDVEHYVKQFDPQVLRNDKRTECDGLAATNFGESKGLGYDRVLIFPTGPIKQLLKDGKFDALKAPSKLYVAVTRARQSVAFVYDGACPIDGTERFEVEPA